MRWIFRLIGATIILVVLAVGGISLIPAEKIAGFATQEITARTGREVVFTGKIKPVFYPILGVKTEGFSIGNAAWSDAGPMVSGSSLLVGVELAPLLSGEIKIKEFRLTDADISLERTRDGRVNWSLDEGAASVSSSGASSVLVEAWKSREWQNSLC